jgi:hypothetical protein
LYTDKTFIFYKFICIAVQGVALKYEEEFHQALSSFARAQVSTGRFYTRDGSHKDNIYQEKPNQNKSPRLLSNVRDFQKES